MGIEVVGPGEKTWRDESCDSMFDDEAEVTISSMRSIGSVVNGQDLLRTRSGWHASKAARNDLGPDIPT